MDVYIAQIYFFKLCVLHMQLIFREMCKKTVTFLWNTGAGFCSSAASYNESCVCRERFDIAKGQPTVNLDENICIKVST